MLSVCIPTYRRKDTLRELLASLACEDLSEVEICISDNASNDGTRELVAEWAPKLGRVIFHEWPENVGYDRNLLKVVEIATQDYCWLFGSDDLIAPGGIARILADLHAIKPTGMLVGYLGFKTSVPIVPDHLQTSGCAAKELRGKRLFRAGPDFGFLTRQIFRRDRVEIALADGKWESCIGGGYIHLYLVTKIAFGSGDPTWYRDDRTMFFYRSASFGDQVAYFGSVHRRLMNEIHEINRVFSLACSRDVAKEVLTRGAWRDLSRNLAKWKLSQPTAETAREMRAAMRQIPLKSALDYYCLVAITFIPSAGIRAARAVVRFALNLKSQWTGVPRPA
jgi:glycosyltransferase involved in cell wall biosynthesis